MGKMLAGAVALTDGVRSAPFMSSYSASKHGVVGLTRTAAVEYAASGIRINSVCPGWVVTDPVERRMQDLPHSVPSMLAQEPIGRMGEPGEIAEAVVWLCSDASSFVTGAILPVDGGYLA